MRSVTDTIVISPNRKKYSTGLRELWVYRELFYFFAWRDIKVRYKQTFLGIGWAVLQPMITAVIFTVFFNRVARIDTGSLNVPYPVFVYLGLTFWGAFASATSSISNSILNNSGVINKIYFPRIIPALASVVLSIVDFFFAIIVFFVLCLIFGVNITLFGVAWIVPSMALLLFAALGIGLLFAALNVKYRDMRSALPFIIQATFFMTPVIYPISLIPERFQIYSYINPAAGAISSVKSALFGQPIYWNGLIVSLLSAIIIFIIGFMAFKRVERRFTDYL